MAVVDQREREKDKSNMLLLLLVVSAEQPHISCLFHFCETLLPTNIHCKITLYYCWKSSLNDESIHLSFSVKLTEMLINISFKATFEFFISEHVLQQTLDIAKLGKIG